MTNTSHKNKKKNHPDFKGGSKSRNKLTKSKKKAGRLGMGAAPVYTYDVIMDADELVGFSNLADQGLCDGLMGLNLGDNGKARGGNKNRKGINSNTGSSGRNKNLAPMAFVKSKASKKDEDDHPSSEWPEFDTEDEMGPEYKLNNSTDILKPRQVSKPVKALQQPEASVVQWGGNFAYSQTSTQVEHKSSLNIINLVSDTNSDENEVINPVFNNDLNSSPIVGLQSSLSLPPAQTHQVALPDDMDMGFYIDVDGSRDVPTQSEEANSGFYINLDGPSDANPNLNSNIDLFTRSLDAKPSALMQNIDQLEYSQQDIDDDYALNASEQELNLLTNFELKELPIQIDLGSDGSGYTSADDREVGRFEHNLVEIISDSDSDEKSGQTGSELWKEGFLEGVSATLEHVPTELRNKILKQVKARFPLLYEHTNNPISKSKKSVPQPHNSHTVIPSKTKNGNQILNSIFHFMKDPTKQMMVFPPSSRPIYAKACQLAQQFKLYSSYLGEGTKRKLTLAKKKDSFIPDNMDSCRAIIDMTKGRSPKELKHHSSKDGRIRGQGKPKSNFSTKGSPSNKQKALIKAKAKATLITQTQSVKTKTKSKVTIITQSQTSSTKAPPIPSSNVGHKLLASMGWAPGQALGANGDGLLNPILPSMRTKRSGLGS